MKCPDCGRKAVRVAVGTYVCRHGRKSRPKLKTSHRRRPAKRKRKGPLSKAAFLRRMRLGRLRAARRRKR